MQRLSMRRSAGGSLALILLVIAPSSIAAGSDAPRTPLWSEGYTVPEPNRSKPPPAAACPVGTAVEVLYGGKWYAAQVLRGPDEMGTCFVHYDGYDASWDEWVNPSRIRPRSTASAPAQPAAPKPPKAAKAPMAPKQSAEPAPAESATIPEGNYPCYAFNGTSLDYTYVDVRILPGARYAVGTSGGSYQRSGKTLRFTGHLANATGTYALKSGTPEIVLAFNDNIWSSMSCARSK